MRNFAAVFVLRFLPLDGITVDSIIWPIACLVCFFECRLPFCKGSVR